MSVSQDQGKLQSVRVSEGFELNCVEISMFDYSVESKVLIVQVLTHRFLLFSKTIL